MAFTPLGNFPPVIDPTSFDDYSPNASTVGVHYRRNGPIQHQHRHYWGDQGQQSMMYGPYDPIPRFGPNDAFVNQADEIDRHRQQYGQMMAGSSGTPGPTHLQLTNGNTAQADLRFARIYFQNPLYAVLNLDGGLPTSPATSGYLSHSTATPTSAAGSSSIVSPAGSGSIVSPRASRSAHSDDFRLSSPLRRHSFNTVSSRRTSFAVHSPTSPSARSGSVAISPLTARLDGIGQRGQGLGGYASLPNGSFTQRTFSGGSRSVSTASSGLDGRLMSSPTALATVDEELIPHRDRGR